MIETVTLSGLVNQGASGIGSNKYTCPEDIVVLGGTVSLQTSTGMKNESSNRDYIATTLLYGTAPMEGTTESKPDLFALKNILNTDTFAHVKIKQGVEITASFTHVPSTAGAVITGQMIPSVVLYIIRARNYSTFIGLQQQI